MACSRVSRVSGNCGRALSACSKYPGLAIGRPRRAFSPACRKYCTACGSRRPRTQCSARAAARSPACAPKPCARRAPIRACHRVWRPRRDALIQEILIQGMAKAKARGDRPIRPFGTATRLEELPVVRQRRAHSASISSSLRSRLAATAAAANSTPATLAAASRVWTSRRQCASCCSSSARSVAGTIVERASTPPRMAHLLVPHAPPGDG